jgi:hypothetical protein
MSETVMRMLIQVLAAVTIASCTPSREPSSTTSNAASSPREAKLGRVITVEGSAQDAKLGDPSSTTSNAASPPWEAKLGQVITVEGSAQDAKLGALLLTGGSMSIWIDGLDAWPKEVRGKNVQVTGKVIQRSDLPVFVHQEGEPEKGGMPVPPGTDLEKARRRLLLAEAKWKVLE